MKYGRIIAAVMGEVWAIEPAKGQAMLQFLAFAAAGGKATPEDIEEAKKLNPRTERAIARAQGGVAVIPITGIMAQHSGMMAQMSGGTSTDRVGRQISAAAASEEVKAIVLRVASPGGSTYGLEELSARIRAARDQKPVVAVADSYAASAAYWVAAQATELVVSPGGDVGSIGVYAVHENLAGMLEQKGVEPTIVSAGEYKVEGNPFGPLGDDARSHMQSRVDAKHRAFLEAVALGRGVDVGEVADNFGKGRMIRDREAVKRNMADRVATLDETISRFTSSPASSPTDSRRAQLERELEIAALV